MPKVDGKQFAYNKAGKKAAATARAKKRGNSGSGSSRVNANKPNSSKPNAGTVRGGQPRGTR